MAPANLSQVLRTGRGAETNQRLNGLRLRGYTRDPRHKRTEPDCGRVVANPDITPFSSSVRIVANPGHCTGSGVTSGWAVILPGVGVSVAGLRLLKGNTSSYLHPQVSVNDHSTDKS